MGRSLPECVPDRSEYCKAAFTRFRERVVVSRPSIGQASGRTEIPVLFRFVARNEPRMNRNPFPRCADPAAAVERRRLPVRARTDDRRELLGERHFGSREIRLPSLGLENAVVEGQLYSKSNESLHAYGDCRLGYLLRGTPRSPCDIMPRRAWLADTRRPGNAGCARRIPPAVMVFPSDFQWFRVSVGGGCMAFWGLTSGTHGDSRLGG